MKLINVTFTETESQLLMLAIIEIKEKWDASQKENINFKYHKEISDNYESIIEKINVEYEK